MVRKKAMQENEQIDKIEKSVKTSLKKKYTSRRKSAVFTDNNSEDGDEKAVID